MTDKRKAMGAAVAVILLAVMVVGIFTVDWSDYTDSDEPKEQPTFPKDGDEGIYDSDGKLKENSLAYTIFEKYGLILIPLALLMFGAMVGGVVISREEAEIDDSD